MALIGYARCSTDKQDLTAQRKALTDLGVTKKRIYLDHGLTGAKRERPGLDQALAAVREGDTLVVPKLDRLARSVPDARDIGDSLAERGVALSLGGSVYDPTDPMGKMFFNILATFAEFELDLIRARTREGMAIAKANGKLKGRQPKLSRKQQTELVRMYESGEHTSSDLADIFSVSRATIYRELKRAAPTPPAKPEPAVATKKPAPVKKRSSPTPKTPSKPVAAEREDFVGAIVVATSVAAARGHWHIYIDVPTSDGLDDIHGLNDLVGRIDSGNTYRLAKSRGIAGWERLGTDLAALATNNRAEQQQHGPGLGRDLRTENLGQPAWRIPLADIATHIRNTQFGD